MKILCIYDEPNNKTLKKLVESTEDFGVIKFTFNNKNYAVRQENFVFTLYAKRWHWFWPYYYLTIYINSLKEVVDLYG